MISVNLHTTLQIKTPNGLVGKIRIDLPCNSTVGDLGEQLNIKFGDSIIIVVNHKTRYKEWVLQDGDRVDFIPAISGG